MKRTARQDYRKNNMHPAASTNTAAMGSLDLQRLKEGFTSLLSQAEPGLLPAFLLWVDLKVAEYKVHGYMFADPENKHEGPWLQLAVDVLKFRFGGPNVDTRASGPSKREVKDKMATELRSSSAASTNQIRAALTNGHSIDARLNHGSQPLPRDCRVDLSHMLSQQQQLALRMSPGVVPPSPYGHHSPLNDLSLVASAVGANPASSTAPYDLSVSRVKQEPHTPVKRSATPTETNHHPHMKVYAGYNTPQKMHVDTAIANHQETPENLSTSTTHAIPSHNHLAQTYPILSKNLNKHVPYDHTGEKPLDVSTRSTESPPIPRVTLKVPVAAPSAVTDLPPIAPAPEAHPVISKLGMPEGASASESQYATPEKNPPERLLSAMETDPAFLATLNPASPNTMGKSPKSSRHVCPTCDKVFPYSSSYRRHLKLHQGVYTHVCAVCHRKFTRKEHFVRHKCNRRPNKPCRGLDGEVKPSMTGKVPKVEFPPMMPGEPFNLENKENNVSLFGGEPDLDSGSVHHDYEAFDAPGSTASPTPSQLAGESRRKSSKPRRCVQTEEEAADDDEEGNSVDSYADSEQGDLIIDMSLEKEKEADAEAGNQVQHSRSEQGGIDLSQVGPPGATLKNGVPSPMVHPREASSPGSVLPPHSDDNMSALHRGHTPPLGSLARPYGDMMMSSSPYHSGGEKMPFSPSPADSGHVAPSGDEEEGKADVLSLETGNYVVNTVADGISEIDDQSSPGKFIKVTKQSNYLKLQKEMRMIGGKPCFVCPNCSKVFHRSSNFSRHMRIHRGIYSYVCPTCNRGFFRKEHFQKHKCHRKAMSYVWERKTKVDMDMQKASSEDGFNNDSEGLADEEMEYGGEYGIDLNDFEESGESSTEEPLLENHGNHGNPAIAIGNHTGHGNSGINLSMPIAVPVE